MCENPKRSSISPDYNVPPTAPRISIPYRRISAIPLLQRGPIVRVADPPPPPAFGWPVRTVISLVQATDARKATGMQHSEPNEYAPNGEGRSRSVSCPRGGAVDWGPSPPCPPPQSRSPWPFGRFKTIHLVGRHVIPLTLRFFQFLHRGSTS